MKKLLVFFLIFLALAFSVSAETKVTIYKNEACGHCVMYLADLNNYFYDKNITVVEKNMINDPAIRQELNKFNLDYGIPIEMQGHLVTVINDKLVLEGHVPLDMVDEYFNKYPDGNFPKLIVFQDLMAEKADLETYKVMGEDKQIKECAIQTSIQDCSQKGSTNNSLLGQSLLFIVLISGLLAGIHPCTISVLLFFIAFLFTIRKTRLAIFKIGAAYIIGIFLAYFLIGLGVLKAVTFGDPHISAKIASVLIIILGLINIFNFLFPSKGIHLGLPKQAKKPIADLVEKASVPSALLIGVIVGICSFGCTAGIYFSITGLLINEAAKGFIYLLLYNLMFIVPLIFILLIASNKRIIKKIQEFEYSESKWIGLAAGLIMIAVGLYIFFMH